MICRGRTSGNERSVGVLRFRLWSRDNGDAVPTDAKVIFQHSWSEGKASFRNIVVKLKNSPEEN